MNEPMLTIREVLEMPVFAASRLVAGAAGVGNQINWVHIVDIPDAHYEWQRRGVLLLTAGYGLRDEPERQAALITKLAAEGFAGMVLAVGYYFERTPPAILETAEALGFPVIESPREILFIEVTEAVLDRLVNHQNRLLQQSSDISMQLTDLVLQGADLGGLAATLARLIGRSVTIEDASFRVVADAQVGPIDEARRASVADGRTSPDLARRLLDAGIYARLLDQMGPIRLPPMPDLDMTLERLVAPIIVDRKIYGYIWVIIDGSPLSELDTRAVTHAATVAALILFKDRAVRRAEEELRGNFLEQLLHAPDDGTIFGEQARRLRFNGNRPQQVLVIAPLLSSGGTHDSLVAALNAWHHGRGASVLSAWRGNHLVWVVEAGGGTAGRALAEELVASFNHPGSRILVGVGGECRPRDLRTGCLRRSYDEAYEAVRIAQATGRCEGVVAFEELGLLHWLYHVPPDVLAGNAFLEAVARLDAYDRERNADLLRTLEAFLEHNGSLVETAEELYIHRNTLLHRLERIKSVCELDLRTAWERLNLYAALKAYRLQPGRPLDG